VRLLADALHLTGADREVFARCSRARGHEAAPAPGHYQPDHPEGVNRRMTVVPRQLPPAARHFAGRARELDQLSSMLGAQPADGTARVCVVSGTAGVGKTALAVRWAHQVSENFPDGQFYVNLRGFTAGDRPVEPADAMRSLLEALGVPGEDVPESAAALAGLYRSLMTGRRVLLLLDNARDASQVRPLLPGDPACLVVVTSRGQLTELVASDGATPVALGVFSDTEATELVARMLGVHAVVTEPEAVGELIETCARLPMALANAVARVATTAGLSLATLAHELRSAGQRLEAWDTTDPAGGLREVFSWSYRELSDPAKRLFRLMGTYPGPGVTTADAADLAGVPAETARSLLRELASLALVAEQPPGWYEFPHALLRAYAAECAHEQDEHV
jgi:hypothetical protein